MVDTLFIGGIIVIAVLFWLFVKLAFGVGGSKGAFLVIMAISGILAAKLGGTPLLFVPLLGVVLQIGYGKGSPLESLTIAMLTLTATVYLQTQVGV